MATYYDAANRFAIALRNQETPRSDTTEADVKIENNNFAFSPSQLGTRYNPKSFGEFHALGGLNGLEKVIPRARGNSVDSLGPPPDGTFTFNDTVAKGEAGQKI
jgi:hypothetical protein